MCTNIVLLLLGIAINVPCDSVAVCPNTKVTFTCSVQSIRLTWIVPESLTDSSNSNIDTLTLLADSIETVTEIAPYEAVIIEGNNCYVLSELTFTVPQELSGTKEISCTPNAGDINNDDEKKACMIKLTEGMCTLYTYSTDSTIIIIILSCIIIVIIMHLMIISQQYLPYSNPQ